MINGLNRGSSGGGNTNYVSILHIEKSGSPGLTPISVYTRIQKESTCVSPQFLQTPTPFNLLGYRAVSTSSSVYSHFHLDHL